MSQEELIKKAKAEYHRKWREEHKDSVKKSQETFWMKKAKELEEKENG